MICGQSTKKKVFPHKVYAHVLQKSLDIDRAHAVYYFIFLILCAFQKKKKVKCKGKQVKINNKNNLSFI